MMLLGEVTYSQHIYIYNNVMVGPQHIYIYNNVMVGPHFYTRNKST